MCSSINYRFLFLALAITTMVGCSTMQANDLGETSVASVADEESEFDQFYDADNNNSVLDPEKLKLEKLTGSADAHKKANQALREQDFDRALFYFVKALEIDPADTLALYTIGKIHASKANYALSIAAYKMVLKVDADHIQALEGLGRNLIKINNYSESRKILNEALLIDNKSVISLTGLAIISDLEKNYSWAEKYYQRAFSIAPESPATLNNYAYSRFLANDWETSEKLYQRLTRLHPKYEAGQLNYALLLARQGKSMEALNVFGKVLTKSQAYNELGYIYLLEKKFELSSQLFQLAIANSPIYFDKAVKNLAKVKSELDSREISSSTLESKIFN